MKPFDLDKALAGHPIVYRNGETPKEWHYFKESKAYQIITINKHGNKVSHLINGRFVNDEHHNGFDLFLAHKEETLWVAVKKVTHNLSGCIILADSSNACSDLKELKEHYPESDYTYHQITREVE